MCFQARPELHVFLLDEWRDNGRNNVENRWNAFLERVFGTQKRENVRSIAFSEVLRTET